MDEVNQLVLAATADKCAYLFNLDSPMPLARLVVHSTNVAALTSLRVGTRHSIPYIPLVIREHPPPPPVPAQATHPMQPNVQSNLPIAMSTAAAVQDGWS